MHALGLSHCAAGVVGTRQHVHVLPEFVTHYYRRSRRPFLNVSDLSDDGALRVMDDLMSERRDGKQHRLFGRKYLVMRRITEARLRRAFLEAGGHPQRTA